MHSLVHRRCTTQPLLARQESARRTVKEPLHVAARQLATVSYQYAGKISTFAKSIMKPFEIVILADCDHVRVLEVVQGGL